MAHAQRWHARKGVRLGERTISPRWPTHEGEAVTTPDPHVPNMNTYPGGQRQGGQPASQPYVPARPVQPAVPGVPAQPVQPVQPVPQGYSAVSQEGAPGQPAYRGVPQPVAPYSLGPSDRSRKRSAGCPSFLRSPDWVSWFRHSCIAPISLTVLCTVTIPKAVALYGSSRSPCTWAFFYPLILSV